MQDFVAVGEVARREPGVERQAGRRRLLLRRRGREPARGAAPRARRGRGLLRPPADRGGRAEDQGASPAPLRRQRSSSSTAGIPAFEAALKANGKAYELYVYQGAQHGFHNDTTPRYDEAAAKLAWQRTIDFFNGRFARVSRPIDPRVASSGTPLPGRMSGERLRVGVWGGKGSSSVGARPAPARVVLRVAHDERLHDVGHGHLAPLPGAAPLGALRRGEPADRAGRRTDLAPQLVQQRVRAPRRRRGRPRPAARVSRACARTRVAPRWRQSGHGSDSASRGSSRSRAPGSAWRTTRSLRVACADARPPPAAPGGSPPARRLARGVSPATRRGSLPCECPRPYLLRETSMRVRDSGRSQRTTPCAIAGPADAGPARGGGRRNRIVIDRMPDCEMITEDRRRGARDGA